MLPGGAIDRRYYELCVLSELRDRLRAGDVWVAGSRQYRSFEERLISRETLQELQQGGTLPIAVDADFERFIAGRRALLDERLAAVDAKAKGGLLPDVTLDKGVLKITPIEKSTPPEAEALAARLYAMLPRIRITDLLSEVARWTLFTDCFTHLRTGETAADPRILMAGLLADGLNLGLTRMAEACSIASLGQLAWTPDWHIRDETYALALRRLVDQQQREPLAAIFGGGIASSSDGQFFQAGGFGRDAGRLNAHYGHDPGIQVLHAPLRPLRAVPHQGDRGDGERGAACARRAALSPERGRGRAATTPMAAAIPTMSSRFCALLGFQFAPRIPDLKNRRLYSFGKPSAYPDARTADRRPHQRRADPRPLVGDPARRRLDPHRHRDGLADHAPARLLPAAERRRRGAARAGAAGAHAVHARLDGGSRAAPRDRPGAQQGRSHATAWRAPSSSIGSAKSATAPTRTSSTALPASTCSSPPSSCGTRDISSAPSPPCAQAEDVPDHLLAHLSPLGWEHVNLTGDYVWCAADAADGKP